MTHCAHQTTSDTQPAVIQRSCACGKETDDAAPCAACSAAGKLNVQPKLTINPPGDRYEQEADRLADQIVAPRAVLMTGPLPITPLVQRQSAEEEEDVQASRDIQRQGEEEEEELQMKPAQTQPRPATADFARSLSAASHGGNALDQGTRTSFEKRLGYDLSSVRYHTGETADRMNRQIGARAFTHGNHIFFARGQMDTKSTSGRRLMAHEVVHTLQQGRGTGRATQSAPAKGAVQRDFPLEETTPEAAEVELTDAQVQEAIQFNTRRYDAASIRLIQDSAGSEVTGVMDEDTVRMVADLQRGFGLTQDGKIGEDTFDLITRSKAASADATGRDDCITSFHVTMVHPPRRFPAGAGLVDLLARFTMRARFEPRCDCSDFEYRQFICGTVFATRPGSSVPIPLNNQFTPIPGGTLPVCAGDPTHEDGNTTTGAGPNYGHRNQVGDINDRYLPNRATGCEYRGFDMPGLTGTDAVTHAGETVHFDFRFKGQIVRRQAGAFRRIVQKQWRVRGNVVI